MKKVILAAMLSLAPAAWAATISIPITDIGTFQDYTNPNTTDTYSGTGFVGLYSTAANDVDAWVHLFGLESSDYSRTILQADLSALAGHSITSATLSFSILDGGAGPHGIIITSYDADGTLRYSWDAPGNLGTVTGNADQGVNTFDVTSLVSSRLAGGDSWLGLHLQGTDDCCFMWTYTDPGNDRTPDSALVRLDITYDGQGEIPEPGTYGLMAAGLASLAWLSRRRR